MDTILILLLVLTPSIFGLISKKFEAAAKEGEEGQEDQGTREVPQPQSDEPYDPMKKLAEIFGMDLPQTSFEEESSEESYESSSESSCDESYEKVVEEATPAVTEIQQRVKLAALKNQVEQEEEEKKKAKEAIDPKKLVIYSEIMKPKYLD